MILVLLFVWTGVVLAAWVGRRRPFRDGAAVRHTDVVGGLVWGLMRD